MLKRIEKWMKGSCERRRRRGRGRVGMFAEDNILGLSRVVGPAVSGDGLRSEREREKRERERECWRG